MSQDRVSPERVQEIESYLFCGEADKCIEVAGLIQVGRELVGARDDVVNDLTEATSTIGVLQETNRKLAEELATQATDNQRLRQELAGRSFRVIHIGPGFPFPRDQIRGL